ncbi:6540_t:CDS:2 [Gigaspora margarita]|uniref:6540_t:CDS:1 n=1 Tax=Gigaspora margarita TaxID=4874 RepID=A0ABN7UIM2_GIGMA|nr:6540_t:CDS:2 [Gigaspora margarita]
MRDLHAQITIAYINMQQLLRQGKREGALAHAYFIGQTIEAITSTPAQRTACRNLLTKYYATVGVDYIARMITLNFRMIRDLRLSEYQSLL